MDKGLLFLGKRPYDHDVYYQQIVWSRQGIRCINMPKYHFDNEEPVDPDWTGLYAYLG